MGEITFPPDYWRPRHQVDANGKPKMNPTETLYETRARAEALRFVLGEFAGSIVRLVKSMPGAS